MHSMFPCPICDNVPYVTTFLYIFYTVSKYVLSFVLMSLLYISVVKIVKNHG